MPREQAEPQLAAMVASLRHERFYEVGIWIDEALGVYVGWTARKGSSSDGMPLQNETGDRVLVCSGETINGWNPDAPSFPADMNGRFHGLQADRRTATTTVFNDRYGMHRLYYHANRDAFYFSAEAKAILAVRPELRRTDPQGIGELISCGCVLEDRTLFEGVHVLPTASAWTFRGATVVARKTYFTPDEWENQPELDPESYYTELRNVFSQKVPQYFLGPDKVGMSLTGGLDTRMVMAWQRRQPGTLPCYTFGGTFRECADVRVARRVAGVCGQPHRVIPVGDEFLRRFHDYAERTVYLTDGCADVSRSPDLYVNQAAREIAPVRMTGNYGGEVLRRVRAFKPVETRAGLALFQGELRAHIRRARHTYADVTKGHPLSFAVFRQAPWHHYGLLALEQTQVALRSPFLDNDFVRTVFRAPASSLTSNEISLRLIADGNPELRELETDRGPADGGLWEGARRSGTEFLRKAEYAFDYGMPQWIVPIDRRLGRLHLERLFLGRHKFFHFRLWYRDALSRYVRDMLLDPRTLSRPYLERKQVERLVNDHVTARANHTLEIHKLLTLEHVHRLFVDPQPVSGPVLEARETVNV